MKKVLLTLLAAALLLGGLAGCSKQKNSGDESQNYADPNSSGTSGPLVWSQVETNILSLEKAITELAETHEQSLIPASDEEVIDLVKRVEEGYEILKDGIYSEQKEIVLELYETARKLELSGNEHVMSLGAATKEFILGMLGHTVVEDVTLLQDGVISALAYVQSVYGSTEETD